METSHSLPFISLLLEGTERVGVEMNYSTVTVLAKFLGWSTSKPNKSAI